MRSMLLGAHDALISSNAWLVNRLKTVEVKFDQPHFNFTFLRAVCLLVSPMRTGIDGKHGVGAALSTVLVASRFDVGAFSREV